jgi:hypothetical protein
MDGVEKRPFLVALDSTNGNLTVLDPLLGTICAETTVKIASTPNPDLLGAKICFQTPESGGSNAAGQPSLVYILDPSTTQVIELTLSFSTPGSHSGIVPVDDSR